jgi:uncharacterized repeat protein (TIGR02543 family)
VVALTAVPAASWTFQGWSGYVTGTQNPASITMDANKTVTATFTQIVPEKVHDVAVTSVSVSPSLVYVGESVQIDVVAANLGDYSETFDVKIYYDLGEIQVVPVNSLSPHSSETLTVQWNTANVSVGVYTVGANATVVPGDINAANNNFVDGKVTILSVVTTAFFVPYWLFIVGFMAFGLLAGTVSFVMLMIAYADRRRRLARAKTASKGRRYGVIVHRHV